MQTASTNFTQQLELKAGYGALHNNFQFAPHHFISISSTYGMVMPGRSISSSSYRYGFNTQENLNELSGDGNHTSALFWEYDTRLGRRWNLDPVDQINISNYACFANNPVYFSDVLGNTVKGNDEKSAATTVSEIKNSFSSAPIRNLFKLDSDNVSVKKISRSDLKNAIKASGGADTDEAKLAIAYFKAINEKAVHTIEIVERKDPLSYEASQKFKVGYGAQIDDKFGGGVNMSSPGGDSYSVIVSNSSAIVSDYVDKNTGKYKTGIISSSIAELIAHEVLGHGEGSSSFSKSQDHEDAIQMTNLYLRVSGKDYYRDGSKHNDRGKPIMAIPQLPRGLAESIPSHYQKLIIEIRNEIKIEK